LPAHQAPGADEARGQDLVLLDGVREDYGQLTAKVLACFKWITSAAPFEAAFVLKVVVALYLRPPARLLTHFGAGGQGDDDTFVRVPLVLKELEQLEPAAR
jgi:hypothetical protein